MTIEGKADGHTVVPGGRFGAEIGPANAVEIEAAIPDIETLHAARSKCSGNAPQRNDAKSVPRADHCTPAIERRPNRL